jgi:hypothetical protein
MIKLNGPLAVIAALACASTASLAPRALADTAYEMSSYAGWPGGKQIAARDYAAAIGAASRGMRRLDATTALVAATNLCVAYTVTRELAAARPACDRAVALAKHADHASLRRFPRSAATAQALSNRGVLRAVSGDAAGATSDFDAAARMKGASAAASRNLAHLQSSPPDRLALAERPAE